MSVASWWSVFIAALCLKAFVTVNQWPIAFTKRCLLSKEKLLPHIPWALEVDMALNCKVERNVAIMFSIRRLDRFGCRFFNPRAVKGKFESKGRLLAYLPLERYHPAMTLTHLRTFRITVPRRVARWARALPRLALVLCTAASAQSVKRGQVLFEAHCVACHALDINRAGPALRGVVGRAAGKAPDFFYSEALESATHVWDTTQLNTPPRNCDLHT
ncbi:MAG: c-type cytochrome [Candidatus Saccharibacteria bacterium]|nr:c-type cytochrome [Rhodoferax sp.]